MKNNEYHGDEHLLTDEERRNVFLDDFHRLSDRVDWLAKTSWLPDGDDQDALETLAFFVDIAIIAKKKTL